MSRVKNPLLRYVLLRPPLLWSVVMTLALTSLLFAVRWGGDFADLSLDDAVEFQMVEFRIPAGVTRPDIQVSDNPDQAEVREPEKKEEEKLRFGDDSGEFGDLANAAVAPRPIFNALPQYPASMRRAGIEGVVIIEIGIDTDGRVLYGRIVQSLGREFDRTVIEWARHLRFHPALDRERSPMRSRVRFPVRFRLEE